MIHELQALEKCGVDVMIGGELKNVKIVVGGVTGDNLFLNGLLGYVESFTANFPCRHCLVHRSLFSEVWEEIPDKIRTVQNYNDGVSTGIVQETGLKQASPLNELTYFHAATNYIQDSMHDLLEGVCSYDLVLISRSLIGQGYFDLDTLNSRFQSLQYSYHEVSNKPPTIVTLDIEMLPFTASEIWCFTVNYSLAVGHLVPDSDQFWQMYLSLRHIMDIIFAPGVSLAELNLLEVTISEYLEMRHTAFPNVTAKNKHHHLIHYPRIIREFGPMSKLWCMRFESKHQRSKRLMHISCNYKNVLKSVSMRHQHDVAYRLLAKQDDCHVKVGPGSVVMLAELTNGCEINEMLGGVGLYFDFFRANWVIIHGTKYKPGCYLLESFDENSEMPQFIQLQDIFVRDHGEIVYFCGSKFETITFDCHLHSWKVKRPTSPAYTAIQPKMLQYFIPLGIHYVPVTEDGLCGQFITLRHKV